MCRDIEIVYDGGGNSTATLVRSGRIIGVWQTSVEPEESIRYHLFDRTSAADRNDAEEALAAAGRMFFDRNVDVVRFPTLRPLSDGGGRSAAHPLDDRQHRASRRVNR